MNNQSIFMNRNNNIPTSNIVKDNNNENNEEFTLKVLTLNCWGVWLGAKKRRQRMPGIVRFLRENNCDIVFLQELWVQSDFEIIREGTKDLYNFAHLFRSGSVLGSSGIVILSRWFPKVIHFEPYSLNGSPFYPWHGDWFAGKGIAYSRLDFNGLSIHLFSTHTHAYYKDNEPIHDQYAVHRVCQSYQLAKFINFISDTACNRSGSNYKDLLIVAGDMNCTSSELPYKIMTTMANLTDCFKRSRSTNHGSNIIHKHKIMNYIQKLYFSNTNRLANDDVSIETGSSNYIQTDDEKAHINENPFLSKKFNDNFLLDTWAQCKHKISQVLFDSDTEDEDITYCHPKNSFTPGSFLNASYKPVKLIKNGSSSTSSSVSTPEVDSVSISRDKSSRNGKDSDFERSVAKPMVNVIEPKPIKKYTKKSPMKRIDFMFCRLLTHGQCVVDRVATESKDQTINCSISDHEPVMVELKICDISHDLIEKNHLIDAIEQSHPSEKHIKDSKKLVSFEETNDQASSPVIGDNVRPLASIVESKVSLDDADEIEETRNQWLPEKASVNLTNSESSAKVMEETRNILKQYHQSNRSSKTKLFYIALFMFMITLPTSTYYALINELIPISTIIFMWFASSFIFSIAILVGFLVYRFEQGAIEAILNDMKQTSNKSSFQHSSNIDKTNNYNNEINA